MTATLDTGDGRSTLRFERLLAHPRERVWRAVTDPAELEQWFPAAVAYEPRAGAPMQFDFGGDHGLDLWPGEVVAWEPPDAFSFLWGEDLLRFELSDAPGGGTLLVFTHAFAHEPGKPARDAAGWESCFTAFDELLAGAPQPRRGDWSALEPGYAERFGTLTVEGEEPIEGVHLTGPLQQRDGRPLVSVRFGERTGVMVVREAGRAFEDGAPVELCEGSADAPGAPFAAGVLRDPLARR